jgi:site-specific DNA-methyltransferase (adenine-specific)
MEKNTIIGGDFVLIGHTIRPNSVDLIFTDPPYVKEGIPCYEAVAKLGARLLKPSGFLVVYASDYWLAETFPPMLKWLNYWYLYHHINLQNATVWPRHIFAKAKSLIVFSKGKAIPQKWHSNLPATGTKEKSHRKDNWEQTVDKAKFFIENFCPAGGLVLDPMCGSGTTLLAAKELGRDYVGIDQDEEQVKMALKRTT